MTRALERPVATVIATLAVARAAVRVWWFHRRLELDALASTLKDVERSRESFDAELGDGIVERLLPLLPPWGSGRCVKRSLLQLDLWARAGRRPRLHIGVFETTSGRTGHVWVTDESRLGPLGRPDIADVWSA